MRRENERKKREGEERKVEVGEKVKGEKYERNMEEGK